MLWLGVQIPPGPPIFLRLSNFADVARIFLRMPTRAASIRIGTAGWSIPRAHSARVPADGTHLERYSKIFDCAEINSSFYRPHRASTYEKWASSTPEDFRFSMKVPKAITHLCGLKPTREQLQTFLEEAGLLGERLGPILFQLPPKQQFEATQAREFFSLFRDVAPRHTAALEPRHAGWFCEEADALLREFSIARVVADPALAPGAEEPGGYTGLRYYRLHGSPRVYYSSYSAEWLQRLAATLRGFAPGTEVWCIFDNTASGAGFENALDLMELVRGVI